MNDICAILKELIIYTFILFSLLLFSVTIGALVILTLETKISYT
jgi:hypothetical protein